MNEQLKIKTNIKIKISQLTIFKILQDYELVILQNNFITLLMEAKVKS